jgi:hypothetical protein
MKKPTRKDPTVKVNLQSKQAVVQRCKSLLLPFRYSLDLYSKAEIVIMTEWCLATFPTGHWGCSTVGWPGYMYFLKESHLTLFLLKWAK